MQVQTVYEKLLPKPLGITSATIEKQESTGDQRDNLWEDILDQPTNEFLICVQKKQASLAQPAPCHLYPAQVYEYVA